MSRTRNPSSHYVTAIVLTVVCVIVSCTHERNEPIESNSLPSPTLSYEDQIQPENGWQIVKTYTGSGMTNFCPGRDTFAVNESWRLRWRVGRASNSKYGSGDMSIEIIDRSSSSTLETLESNKEQSEFSSEIFTVKGNTFCILARSNSTGYSIVVEQQNK